jgi:hypothetical protein
LLHGFFIQLLYANSSCAVFLYAWAQSAMWENMSDCIGAHFRSMKIQSAIFIFFSNAFAWGPCVLRDAIQTFSYSGTTVRSQCFSTWWDSDAHSLGMQSPLKLGWWVHYFWVSSQKWMPLFCCRQRSVKGLIQTLWTKKMNIQNLHLQNWMIW